MKISCQIQYFSKLFAVKKICFHDLSLELLAQKLNLKIVLAERLRIVNLYGEITVLLFQMTGYDNNYYMILLMSSYQVTSSYMCDDSDHHLF